MRVTVPDPRVRAMSAGNPQLSRALSGSSLLQLRRAIAMHRERPLPSEVLGDVARSVAADAWARGLAAEQMLVALKASWPMAEPMRQLPPQVARELFDRVVSLAIRAYYTADSGRGPR